MDLNHRPAGLEDVLAFPLLEALIGRRSRRFPLGAEIPDGPMAYASQHDPLPLSEIEQMLLLIAASGNTGWHYMIYRAAQYVPFLASYPVAPGGRTIPTPAGIGSVDLFYTDDDGVYFFGTRDAPALIDQDPEVPFDIDQMLDAHRACIRKLSDKRLHLPPETTIAAHNTWCANVPGSTLIIPVADVSRVVLGMLAFFVQNGLAIYDDVHDEPIPGMERFAHLIDLDNPGPLSLVERAFYDFSMTELSCACYAGMLMLQPLGLGGWMFTGVNGLALLGASGDAEVPGLGFDYDTDDRWLIPNVTGLPGVFEGYCPPYYPDMRAAVDALAAEKFGPGGPFNAETPGPWKDSATVRSSAQPYSEEFRECLATIAQYIYGRFGKFPGTVPSMVTTPVLQAHHLDLDFYDRFYEPRAYLDTHAEHLHRWHQPDTAS